MLALDRRFTDLGTLVNDVHDMLAWWREEVIAAGALDEISLDLLTLVTHEWVANLVQHADFPPEGPLVKVHLRPEGQRMHCAIEDNSSGFDFSGQIARQRDRLLLSRQTVERGRGLLLMLGCTENLAYSCAPQHGVAFRRLEFWIAPRRHPAHAWPESEHEIPPADLFMTPNPAPTQPHAAPSQTPPTA